MQKCDGYNRDKGCEHRLGQFIFGITAFALMVILFTNCVKVTSLDPNIAQDIDGNIYTITTIGDQIWFAENLKTTKLNDGTNIPHISFIPTWRSIDTPAYCYYDNDQMSYNDIYGVLYNWFTIATNRLCPNGWHVPDYADWQILFAYLGGDSIAGGELKATTNWQVPNTGASDKVGFNALPGGLRDYTGDYVNLTIVGAWWSSTEDVVMLPYGQASFNAYDILLHKHSASIYGNKGVDYPYDKGAGMSVRCLKN
jgi:uncharacterized protein (TIGR02145 family)